MKTVGFSKKVLATVLAACGAQLVAVVVQVTATGEFDRVAVGQVVGAALTAVLGTFAGYQAAPNEVEVDAIPGGGVPPQA
jgi:Ca2+/Na+ antiporter